jgi:hypothetical protein
MCKPFPRQPSTTIAPLAFEETGPRIPKPVRVNKQSAMYVLMCGRLVRAIYSPARTLAT